MDIANFNKDEWNKLTENLCYEGIRQKFMQNLHLRNYLLDTGTKTLVEASYDNVLGTGKPLGSEDSLNPTKWKSTGILGRILMKIRDTTYEGSTLAEYEEEPMAHENEVRNNHPDNSD